MKKWLYLLFIILLVGCADAGTVEPENAGNNGDTNALSFTTVAQGAPLGDGDPEPFFGVAEGQIAWQSLSLPESVLANSVADDAMVVVAYAGTKGSSGYSITITNIQQQDSTIFVTVAQTMPDPNDIVEPATTMPYHLVTLNESNNDLSGCIDFHFQTEADDLLYETEICFSS